MTSSMKAVRVRAVHRPDWSRLPELCIVPIGFPMRDVDLPRKFLLRTLRRLGARWLRAQSQALVSTWRCSRLIL